MMKTPVFMLMTLLEISGCSSVNQKIPMANQPWEITGKVISAETGQTLSGRTVVLLRGQPGSWWCGGCLGSYRAFLQAVTNADGRFRFSSTVPGNYKVEAKCPGAFGAGVPSFDSIGEMSSGQRAIVVRYTETNCADRR